jgi:hypothetical protein
MDTPEDKTTNEDVVDLLRELMDASEEVDEYELYPAEDELYDDDFDSDEWYERAENEDYYAQYE